jgi:hypothetical protein
VNDTSAERRNPPQRSRDQKAHQAVHRLRDPLRQDARRGFNQHDVDVAPWIDPGQPAGHHRLHGAMQVSAGSMPVAPARAFHKRDIGASLASKPMPEARDGLHSTRSTAHHHPVPAWPAGR